MAFIATDDQKKPYIESTLDKFLEQYVFIEDDQAFGTDFFSASGFNEYAIEMLVNIIGVRAKKFWGGGR